jgi:Raf kinase inhibitor-like YbhB/YbcL family protein
MKTKTKIIVIIALVVIISAASLLFTEKTGYKDTELSPNIVSTMKITSPAFNHNEALPAKYTCDGEGVNPPLSIADVPKNAKSLVLIFRDPDAPSGDFVHWTVWNIDPGLTEIAEKSAPGVEGITSYGKSGYGLPCPPSGTHRYTFHLYALDTLLDISPRIDASQLEKAMKGHILDKAELVGLYSRS